MNNNDVSFSFCDKSENKLKEFLRDSYNKHGLIKTSNYLTFNNQLLLSAYGIDEGKFNFILLKNYICFLNSGNKLNFEMVNEDDRKIIKSFNESVKSNNFDEALAIYKDNYCIYQLLSSAYIKKLFETDNEIMRQLKDKKDDTLYKIELLKQTDLSLKKEEKRYVYQNVSAR